MPVLRALNDAGLNEAIDTGSVTPWKLPEGALEAQLGDLIDQMVRRKANL